MQKIMQKITDISWKLYIMKYKKNINKNESVWRKYQNSIIEMDFHYFNVVISDFQIIILGSQKFNREDFDVHGVLIAA